VVKNGHDKRDSALVLDDFLDDFTIDLGGMVK
jgi:hypothetical protein